MCEAKYAERRDKKWRSISQPSSSTPGQSSNINGHMRSQKMSVRMFITALHMTAKMESTQKLINGK